MSTLASDIPRLDVGEWVADRIEWLQDNASGFFDAITDFLEMAVEDWVGAALHSVNPILLAIIFGVIAWLCRSVIAGIVSVLGMLFIQSLDMWDDAMDTLALILVAGVIALAIAVPIGIIAARSQTFSKMIRPVLDLMQTLPVFVYLIPAVALFGIGTGPGVVATVIFAIPPGIRLTELGIRQVNAELVEAGHAFGAEQRAILTRIQIPLAMPTIMAGVNQVIMMALSMVVVAGMVGTPGLGSVVFSAVGRLDTAGGIDGGLAVVVLAIYLDRTVSGLAESEKAETNPKVLISKMRSRRGFAQR